MTIVTVHEAKTHLSRLIADVLAGGEVTIARRGKEPLVKLVMVDPPKPKKRVLGQIKGKINLDKGFWDPLPEDELALWNGEGE